ncbi:MAG: alpha-glucosidase, partial [Clostridiaceae bacterium]
ELDIKIKELNKNDVKFLGYINPYLAIEGKQFKEADENGYLVKNSTGETYRIDMGAFLAGIVDLTNEKAFEWYKNEIKINMIDFGLSGWMADFGEYLPTDAVLYSNESAEKIHNLYPMLWAKLNKEALEETGKKDDIFFFTRSGYSGTQKYSTMMWAGDQNVNWSLDDGLPSVIVSALSLAMTGYGLQHSDIGGYTTLFSMKRTKELFQRWAEFAAFTPLMRTHEGNRPDDNWQFDHDEETLLHFAKMTRVHKELKIYIKDLVRENSLKGIPVMRPLFIHYEQDEKAYITKYEYMFGKDILVAPVIKKGETKKDVYLPKDNWVNLFTGEENDGGIIKVACPIGVIPVFYRRDSKYSDLFKKIKDIK